MKDSSHQKWPVNGIRKKALKPQNKGSSCLSHLTGGGALPTCADPKKWPFRPKENPQAGPTIFFLPIGSNRVFRPLFCTHSQCVETVDESDFASRCHLPEHRLRSQGELGSFGGLSTVGTLADHANGLSAKVPRHVTFPAGPPPKELFWGMGRGNP